MCVRRVFTCAFENKKKLYDIQERLTEKSTADVLVYRVRVITNFYYFCGVKK